MKQKICFRFICLCTFTFGIFFASNQICFASSPTNTQEVVSEQEEEVYDSKTTIDAQEEKMSDQGAHLNKIDKEKELKINANKLVDVDEKVVEAKKYNGIIWFFGVFVLLFVVVFAFT